MNQKVLKDVGIDVEDALSRMMGNENLFKRMMSRFVDDLTYHQLLSAIKDDNQEEIFRHAHTLKGICANLSIKPLEDLFVRQVEFIRNDDLKVALFIINGRNW